MTQGIGNGSVPGAIASVSRALLAALPPAFFLLLVLNVAFLGFVMWFLETQLAHRDQMAEALFNRCMDIALKGAP